jgi:site-specific DNA-methyltransferase (adenine-specific)
VTLIREDLAAGVTIYHGDCRDVIPTLPAGDTIVHVVTDAPYEDEIHAAARDRRIKRTDGLDTEGDFGFAGINADRPEYARLLVKASTGWTIISSLAEGVRAWRDDLQAVGAKWDSTCAWIKPDARPRFNGQGPARGFECFVVCWCGRGQRSWNAGGKRGIYTHCVNTEKRHGHPTEKPLALMGAIVTDFTQPGQIILDPFMGSGTTGVAAIRHGRRFVGVEKSPQWFDVARRRLTEALKQPDLFIAVPLRLRQEALL